MNKTLRRLLSLTLVLTGTLALVAACGKEEPAPILDPLPGFNARGASLAKFSVSMTQKVHFSRGNLQYQPSSGRWRFAPHQYDCSGTANDNISATTSTWIDLFAWGTSGWDSGGAVFFRPWDIFDSAAGYGPGQNNLVNDKAKTDWAYFNRIQYGGDTAKYWRTLTAGEWRYLLAGRNNAVNLYALASIDDVKGLIILPDEWVPPHGTSLIVGIRDTTQFDYTLYNKFSASEWIAFDTAGAIFLPAAGVRLGTKTTDVGRNGFYWSSSSAGDSLAVNMAFSVTKQLLPEHPSQRNYGFAVRPVVNAAR